MRPKINYFAWLLSVGAGAFSATAVMPPYAHATNILTFERGANNNVGAPLDLGATNSWLHVDLPRSSTEATLDTDSMFANASGEYSTALSGMDWVGCPKDKTCNAETADSPQPVAATWLSTYAGNAMGANFDVAMSSNATKPTQMEWVTEPASFALFGTMLCAIGFIIWRTLKRNA